MICTSKEILERYNISAKTLQTLRKQKKISVLIHPGNSKGFLFDTDVTDKEAREGKLGNRPLQAILNLDKES